MRQECREDEQSKRTPLTMAEVANEAREALLQEGQHPSTIIAEGQQKMAIIQLIGVAPTHPERMAQMLAAGFQLAASGGVGTLEQVFHISEAWLSRVAQGQELQQPPSQDPQRLEVLIISQLGLHRREAQLAIYEMIRNAEAQLCELRETESSGPLDSTADVPLLVAFVEGYGEGRSQDPHQ